MKPPKIGSTNQPFPLARPEITVSPSRARAFTVDCRTMPGWGIPLDLGAESWIAWYDPPRWRLTCASYLRVLRPAEVHGLEGLEIEELQWDSSARRWDPSYTYFARLTDKSFEWLATAHVHDGKRILYTFLDDGFDDDWGQSRRRLAEAGRMTQRNDGSYALRVATGETGDVCVGAGMFRVRIGRRSFTCLRSIEIAAAATRTKVLLHRSILAESFYTRAGRLVLFRRYNGRLWNIGKAGKGKAALPWDKRLPSNARLVINGAMFVHWYDCLTDVSCGFARR